MIDYNSPEKVSQRVNQEDPIIMYLIVRESLNMSIGKTAAQVGHAVQMLHLKYEEEHQSWLSGWTCNVDQVKIFQEWLDTSFRKVVLKADDREFAKVQKELPNDIVLVTDAGLTELAPQTDTVIGVFPMRKSEVPKVIKRLQVLK